MGVYIWEAGAEEYNLADIASQSVNPPSDEIKTVTITFDDTEPTWKSLTVNGGNILLSVAQSTLNTIMVLGWDSVDLSQYGQSSSHTRGTVSYDFVQHTYSIDIIATIDGVDVSYQRNNAPLAGYISTIDSRDMTSSITLSGNIKIEAIPEQLDLKNAYIGEYQEGWQPGANTIAYYKFDGNLNDDSGNSHDMSLYTGSVTYGTASGGGKYAHFNQNTWTNYWTYSGFNYDGEYTISFRFNPQTIFSSGGPHDIVELRENSTYAYLRIANSILIVYGLSTDYSTSLSSNTWYNIIYTRNGNSAELFINGVLVISGTPSFSGRTNQTMRFRVNQVPDTNSSSYANNGYYSEIIWENKARTTQEKINYYNQTKSLYGIS